MAKAKARTKKLTKLQTEGVAEALGKDEEEPKTKKKPTPPKKPGLPKEKREELEKEIAKLRAEIREHAMEFGGTPELDEMYRVLREKEARIRFNR